MTQLQMSALVEDVLEGLENPNTANMTLRKHLPESDAYIKQINKYIKDTTPASQWVRVGVSDQKPEPHWVKDSQKQYGY